jgi:hypothetical protein
VRRLKKVFFLSFETCTKKIILKIAEKNLKGV